MSAGWTTPDLAALEELFDLEDGEDRDMLVELYEDFLDEGLKQLDLLKGRMESGDLHAVDEIAHRLKSSFGNLGFPGNARICQQIMQHARVSETTATREAVRQLDTLRSGLEVGIRDFLKQL